MAVSPVILERYGGREARRSDGGAMRRRSDSSSALASQPSFAAFYETYAGPILRYCLVRISSAAEAEDAAATVFDKAFAAWPPENPAAVRSWVFAIAHNVVANHYRTKSKQPSTRPIDEAFAVPDRSAQPSEIAEQREVQLSVRAAVAQLTVDQREVIELRLTGLNGPEIAETTGRSHAAVKMLQYRAMLTLRTLLEPERPASSLSSNAETGDRL